MTGKQSGAVRRIFQAFCMLLGNTQQYIQGSASRADNIVVSQCLASATIPVFSLIYVVLGDLTSAAFCAMGLAGVGASAWLLRTRRLELAALALVGTVWLVLLVLIYRVGGTTAPSMLWLPVCPLLAAACSGVRGVLVWSVIVVLSIICIHAAEYAGLFPPPVVQDLRLLTVFSSVCFVLIVSLFLMLYESNNAAALRSLNLAMQTIGEMATRDELTGSFNRRELFRVAVHKKQQCERLGIPMALCLIDIDHFKTVNDTWGHIQGDAVLKRVAMCIESLMRVSDSFGRYGGEEFVMVLVGTDLAGATVLAERIRCAVAALVFPELGTRAITISTGIALTDAAHPLEHALARADAALYVAKKQGRNRIALETELEPAL